jgi:hypothetical protein
MANGMGARQREERTTKTLPYNFGEALGNDGVAEPDIAVWHRTTTALPCK